MKDGRSAPDLCAFAARTWYYAGAFSLFAGTSLGFNAAEPSGEGHPRVEVGGAYVEFHPGDPGDAEKPLLNHVAVLVDEVDPVIAEAEERDIVDNVVDAANTRAVFVWGPERVRIEYVEHKPGFALK